MSIPMVSWQKGLTRAGPFLSGPWKEDRGEGVRRHMLEQLHMELCCTQLIAAVTGNYAGVNFIAQSWSSRQLSWDLGLAFC